MMMIWIVFCFCMTQCGHWFVFHPLPHFRTGRLQSVEEDEGNMAIIHPHRPYIQTLENEETMGVVSGKLSGSGNALLLS